MDTVKLFKQALDRFEKLLKLTRDNEWTKSTPCSKWDVRALVNHVVNEVSWVAPLVEGKTIAEVGDKYDGDLLGEDPLKSFRSAGAAAVEALSEPAALERTVHLSFGDFSAHDYAGQMISDVAIHGWDLAKAIGGDTKLPAELVEVAMATFGPMAEGGRQAGIFGPAKPTPPDAGEQTKLLALTGREA